jgi:hypothetical protein
MNLAKSLIVSEKNFFNHRAPMQWKSSFCRKSALFLPPGYINWSDTQASKRAIHFYLEESNYRTYWVCDGCSVNILLKLWVCKLSFLKRHPSIQKSKILKHRALLQWKKKYSIRWMNPASLNTVLRDEESSEWKPKYGIELPTSIKIISVGSVENLGKF